MDRKRMYRFLLLGSTNGKLNIYRKELENWNYTGSEKSYKATYSYFIHGEGYFVFPEKYLDKFYYDKAAQCSYLCSFDPDIDRATKIIEKTISYPVVS